MVTKVDRDIQTVHGEHHQLEQSIFTVLAWLLERRSKHFTTVIALEHNIKTIVFLYSLITQYKKNQKIIVLSIRDICRTQLLYIEK